MNGEGSVPSANGFTRLMKTAAKVFLILGIIFSFYLIYPLVLGIIACKKLGNSKDIEEIHNWGIISLILVSIVGGIIMLVMKEEDLYDSPEEAAAAKARKAQGWYAQQNAGGTPYYCGYDDRGGYHDGYGGYYDAAGGYYAPDGRYYPPKSNG